VDTSERGLGSCCTATTGSSLRRKRRASVASMTAVRAPLACAVICARCDAARDCSAWFPDILQSMTRAGRVSSPR